MNQRCSWCLATPEYIAYHDTEWGVPNHDDTKHFEFLILESAQAGLSWLTVLKKRDGYRAAFANFDAKKVAQFTDTTLEQLMSNPNIIRNRQKISAAINNAQKFLEVQREFGSFDSYIWSFVEGKQLVHFPQTLQEIPATSPESDALSKDLKSRGFKFVGSTIMYAHMQAMGLYDDHMVGCFRKTAIHQQ
ncbi:MAG: DNA-3-methyladenine glycosylase I [Candidatus Dojkabacteria bacterium]|nr:MAG: DNA-3-methyladenine glycosylase I [Candidatus Dojkabacteria bacterium]